MIWSSDELPSNWPLESLSRLTSKVGSGATPRGGATTYAKSGIPLIRSQNVRFDGFSRTGLAFLSDNQARQLDNVTVECGDVLLNITGASIGRVSIAPEDMTGARVNQHVCIIRPTDRILASFLAAYLSAPQVQDAIAIGNYGVTREALTKSQVLDLPVPVPDLREQEAIVTRLDLLSSSRLSALAHLDNARRAIGRFRQAVLAAACSGRLTADWRELTGASGASVRMIGTLKRRKEQWNATMVKASSSLPTYKEPLLPTTELDVPSTWAVASLSQLAHLTVGNAFRSSEFTTDGIRLLRGENTAPGQLQWLDVRYLPREKVDEVAHLLVEDGDLILAMDRPIIANGLKLARVTSEDVPSVLVQRVLRIRAVEPEGSDFIELCLLDGRFEAHLAHDGMTGTDLPHITGTGVAEFPVPLPPLEEQREIVRRARMLLRLASRAGDQIRSASQRVERSEQAVLAKAFRGELLTDVGDPS